MNRTLLAALLFATPALAQEVPTPIAVSAPTSHAGTFAHPGDVAVYTARLTAGQDVALALYGDMLAELRGPSGTLLRRATVTEHGDTGFEHRALATGTHTIRLTARAATDHVLNLAPDCRAASSTTCVLKPGTTQVRQWGWPGDHDWHRLSLTAGRTYRLTVAPTLAGGFAAFLDSRGRTLRECEAAGGSTCTVSWRPTRSGTYYALLRTNNDDSGESYTVSLR